MRMKSKNGSPVNEDFPTLRDFAEELKTIRVLLIEDNPGDALLMQELVSEAASEQFTMDWEASLSNGLERLKEIAIDLIVLDLSLPDSQGWETFARVRQAAPHVALIVLSGLDDEALAVKIVQKGAQDYLVKGHVDGHSLARAMRYAIERRQAEKALADERNLLRSLLDNLPDAVYVKDLKGHYLIDNEAHMRLLGADSINGIRGKTVFDFLPEDSAREVHEDDENILATGNPVLSREEGHRMRKGVQKWFSTTKVPLRDTEGKILGIVGIDRDITERKEAEEKLARYNAALKERNEQHESDQRMAREIQQALLPHRYPCFPHTANPRESALRFCHTYQPTELVGGDFYHVLPLSDTEAGVFICDVMGHGVQSALVTAILRAVVEELMSVAHDPGTFLREINRALAAILTRTGTLMFATAFYLIADVSRNQIRFANAGGHPSPLHIRRDAKIVEPLVAHGQTPGPALGLLEDSVYPAGSSDLALHDVVFLFTDGLYEVEGANGEYYDQDRLFKAVRKRLKLPPQRLFEELVSEIQTFATHKKFMDDVCLVGMEVIRTGIRSSESEAESA